MVSELVSAYYPLLLKSLPVTAVLAIFAGCEAPRIQEYTPAGLMQPQEETAQPELFGDEILLARVDEEAITLADLQRHLDRLSPEGRARLHTGSQRRQFLQALIHLMLLAQRAQQMGLEQDPAVRLAMEQAISEVVLAEQGEREVDCETIEESRLRDRYQAERSRYHRPEQMRLSLLLVEQESTARSIRSELDCRLDTDLENTLETFESLMRNRGIQIEGIPDGDLGFVSRDQDGPMLAETLWDAVAELENPGQIAGPIALRGGWAIVLLTERRLAYSIPFVEAKPALSRRLCELERREARQGWLRQLRNGSDIRVNAEVMAQLDDPFVIRGESMFVRANWLNGPGDNWAGRLTPRRELSPLADRLQMPRAAPTGPGSPEGGAFE